MYYAFVVVFVVAATALFVPTRLDTKLVTYLRSRPNVSTTVFCFTAAGLIASQLGSLALVRAAFAGRTALAHAELTFPVKIFGFRDSYVLASVYGDSLTAIAIVQSIGLAIVAVAMLRPSRTRWTIIALTSVCTMFVPLASTTATSGDMYSNVGYALLGSRSYDPPDVPFTGTFAPIAELWGTPLVRTPYGPLWLAIDRVTTAPGTTLFAKIVLLRLLDLVAIGAIAALLKLLKFSSTPIAVVTVNPAIAFEFVANVHNDLVAVALLLGARAACERRKPVLAVALAASAGLVKIPFALFSVASFLALKAGYPRIAAFCATVFLAVAGSLIFSHGLFFGALDHHVREHVGSNGVFAIVVAPEFLLRIAAVPALLALLLCDAWNDGIVYAIPLLGAELYPWYALWALPYAALRERALVTLLVVFPVVRIATDITLASGDAILVLQKVLFAIFAGITAAYTLRRFRRTVT